MCVYIYIYQNRSWEEKKTLTQCSMLLTVPLFWSATLLWLNWLRLLCCAPVLPPFTMPQDIFLSPFSINWISLICTCVMCSILFFFAQLSVNRSWFDTINMINPMFSFCLICLLYMYSASLLIAHLCYNTGCWFNTFDMISFFFYLFFVFVVHMLNLIFFKCYC